MRTGLVIILLSVAFSAFAAQSNQQPAAEPAGPPPASPKSNGCLAVKDAGSHAFRNIMLAGIAGALISKKQYQVVDVVDYPARVGEKFHGDDLQTIQGGGTKIVILDKKYTKDDLAHACR